MPPREEKEDKLAKAFGVAPLTNTLPVEVKKDINQSLILEEDAIASDEDYNKARDNISAILEKGMEALDDFMTVAKGSEAARSYEVLGNFMKTLSDINKDLLELSSKKKDIDKAMGRMPQPDIVNNNLFVGNASELLKMMKQINESSGGKKIVEIAIEPEEDKKDTE